MTHQIHHFDVAVNDTESFEAMACPPASGGSVFSGSAF